MKAPLDERVVAGLERQAMDRTRLIDAGARHLGWKAGFGTAAAMAKLGTTAPLVGFLTDRTLRDDGATCAVGRWAVPTLEAEIAVRLGRDIAPGASRDAVGAAIEAVAPAIELVDLGAADDVAAILAGNIFHRAVLLGPFAPADDLNALRLDVIRSGDVVAEGVDPSDMLGDLRDVVRLLGDQLPAAGAELRAGDVIITGAGAPARRVVPGEDYEVRAAGGRVGLRIVA